ncbi:MAG: hypothetical protein A3A98_01665 [Candidatus Staskawiczbacteria bacterium RIFCSPLOWO2_01_FULL_40_39]|uniref:Uncharacterized protein n=1 Tax=Candidatus Staskawiczbacteria bacterium RIFCSPHIGHO2_01_FULL_39_25 TaxID=1802202 RepID=A0A1G2HQF3_9BACT|nr:MAG: hypothetical protein A2730_01820 [Candidatus Staskawiczbacteria bacterium RIFCSPHIGHO2_01_FULL_39_25]OGZ72681.1 MAG: hypothetical protein A3A98_01665 [Candidatus Staskawiczbacteria bacterium RIFCSPLOWO2_01_FULL_40_39]
MPSMWWYVYHRPSVQNGMDARIREIVQARTAKEAGEKLREIAKRDGKVFCATLHGPYHSMEEAQTVHKL